MHPLENHLLQLQEMILIRDEQKVHGNTHHLEQLDGAIKSLLSEVPEPVQTQYRKLYKKDHAVIVPVSIDNCAGCGMKLPISLVQAVRIGKELYQCPTCARLLYYPEAAPRAKAKREPRFGPRKVGITRFSSHTLMIPALKASTLDEAIAELAHAMEDDHFVDGADKLVEAALRREAVLSTAVGHNMAFPHVRGVEGGGLSLALGLHEKGLKVDGGNSPVKIIFFLVIPTAASAFYLKLLSGLTETFRDAEKRKKLLACKDADELWKTLVKLTRTTVK